MNICEECGEECEGTYVDQGIGPVEFWGVKSWHKDVVYVSDCCEGGITNEDGREIMAPDEEGDRIDRAYEQWKDEQMSKETA